MQENQKFSDYLIWFLRRIGGAPSHRAYSVLSLIFPLLRSLIKFLSELNKAIESIPFSVIATAIDKRNLKKDYPNSDNL